MSESYAKLFLIDDGETLQLLFSLDSSRVPCASDEPFALDFAYWIQLNRQAEAVVNLIPLDFPALLKRLRQGAVK
ncbi:MAG: hypothetical protein Q7T90_12050 [Thiobacillus sp.]|nr:hypothetical protein [Thiobacillus sp.]